MDGRCPCPLRLTGAGAIGQAQVCCALGVRGIFAIDLFDVITRGLDHLAPGRQTRFHREHLGLDVFERIDPIPTWRDPLHWPSLNWICIQRARQHGRFQPAPPDRATQLMGHDPVLQLTDPPPELDQFCP